MVADFVLISDEFQSSRTDLVVEGDVVSEETRSDPGRQG